MSQALLPTNFDPNIVYAGASNLSLTQREMEDLSAQFNELDYEITPQGHLYLPQAVALQRLNKVIGVGRWTLLLINTGSEDMKNNTTKVFYDGALMIRGFFVSRAAGEATYSTNNAQQSYATALESAKTDCRVRCCKDIGVGTDAWLPAFIREWKRKYAVRVNVRFNDGKTATQWRRSDLDPLPGETGIAQFTPTVPTKQEDTATELPWLNDGPDYDKALASLKEGALFSTLRKGYRLSKKITEQLMTELKEFWDKKLKTIETKDALTEEYNKLTANVNELDWLKQMFYARRDELLKPVKVKANAKAKAA